MVKKSLIEGATQSKINISMVNVEKVAHHKGDFLEILEFTLKTIHMSRCRRRVMIVTLYTRRMLRSPCSLFDFNNSIGHPVHTSFVHNSISTTPSWMIISQRQQRRHFIALVL